MIAPQHTSSTTDVLFLLYLLERRMSTMSQFPPTKPGNYRGALVYRQEDGYTMVTLTVSIAPNEHSHVISHAYGLPISEETEHLPGVDLYHFAAPYGTRIELSIASPMGVEEAWFTVSRHTVLTLASPLHLDIVRSSEGITPAPATHSTKETRQRSALVEIALYQGRK
jgi:hypothetical protein